MALLLLAAKKLALIMRHIIKTKNNHVICKYEFTCFQIRLHSKLALF